jgi:hypothetical protein
MRFPSLREQPSERAITVSVFVTVALANISDGLSGRHPS